MARTIVFAIIIGLFAYVTSPLLIPLSLGALFAILFFPVQSRLERWKFPHAASASLVTLGVSVLILLPAAVLLALGVQAAVRQFRTFQSTAVTSDGGFLEALLAQPVVAGAIERAAWWFQLDTNEILRSARDFAETVLIRTANLLADLVGKLPALGIGLAVMIVSLFFFLLDGRRIVEFLRRNSVLSKKETDSLLSSTGALCRSVILASVASGAAQSLLFGVACIIAGADNTPLIGLLVFLASFIPLIGAAPITFGFAIHEAIVRGPTFGVVLGIAAVAASLLDNVIRPAVLRGAADLHPLLAFVAAFGGLQVFGFAGVFFGPILAGMAMAVIRQLTQNPQRS